MYVKHINMCMYLQYTMYTCINIYVYTYNACGVFLLNFTNKYVYLLGKKVSNVTN